MTIETRAARLAQAAPFSELSEAELTTLDPVLETRQLAEDEVLGPFDPPASDGLYVIETGEIALVDSVGSILEKRRPGELNGHAIRNGLKGRFQTRNRFARIAHGQLAEF